MIDSRHQNDIYLVKKKNSDSCASCKTKENDTEENYEEIQLLVVPPKKAVSESSDDNDNDGESGSLIAGRTRGQKPSIQAPLRQTVDPNNYSVCVYVPFTTLELLN